jgi:elongation factor G
MKAIRFSTEDQGGTLTYEEIPADLMEKAEYYRAELIEKVSEVDDDMMELFLTDPSKITNEHIKAGLRKGTIAIKCVPVLCGAALKNIGVQKILDAAIDYLPNPTERPDTKGVNPDDVNQAMTRPHDPTAPFSALVFKVVSDTHGDLTYIRVYSGKLDKGTRVLNPGNGKRENVSRIFEMHANNRNALEEVDAGNIVAVVGLKNSYTGDTICDPENPIILERMTFPEPVISMAIEPITADDKKKLGDALTTIRREDHQEQAHARHEDRRQRRQATRFVPRNDHWPSQRSPRSLQEAVRWSRSVR